MEQFVYRPVLELPILLLQCTDPLRSCRYCCYSEILPLTEEITVKCFSQRHNTVANGRFEHTTNQQPPQHGGAVPEPVWFGSKWLLAFPRVPVTPRTPLHFFAMLHPERPQKGSTQLLQNRSPVFSFSLLLPFSCPPSSPHSSASLDKR